MQIDKALKKYLPIIGENSIEIRFDMPDKDKLPNDPTLCVFLYDIQEDLELRHARTRPYQAHDHTLGPRLVHVRCCYLVTYWGKEPDSKSGPKNQPMQVMNAVLNALLNANLEQTMPPSFSRVIAPSEHLSSMGNFWQSLGDRPRLCLNFTVTIPVALHTDESDQQITPVRETKLEMPEAQSWEQYDKSLRFKRVLANKVLASLKDVDQVQSARVQLARLSVTCKYEQLNTEPKVQVVGLLDAEIFSLVMKIIEDKESQKEWKEIGVQVSLDIDKLIKS
ncbi:DUF4255 domain-containing protein [Mycetohabitans sp. B4]|uniref:DUF4255 domain-containing protein n=1 Tax=Mycetohabitans sp. B4 TaxID=2841842 RepID=UPI001F2FF58A